MNSDPPTFFRSEEIKNIFGLEKQLTRNYITTEIFIPTLPSRGPGTPNLFNLYDMIRVGTIIGLNDLGIPYKKASRLVNEIEPICWQDIKNRESRYLIINADKSGHFSGCFFCFSLPYEIEFEDLDNQTKFVVIFDCWKVLDQIENIY